MKILKIIHGYPPLYNAGSEVYSQTLCHGLVNNGHEVHVFTREENPFADDYSIRVTQDSLDNRVKLHLVNIPGEKHRYRYSHPEFDETFAGFLEHLSPDIVHVGHLNHLSATLITKIKKAKIPIVYTLHDYWLMCPRGQFIQRNSKNELWAVCKGQENQKCAEKCYSGYFSGLDSLKAFDSSYWNQWVATRMDTMRMICNQVDHFIAPSKYLYKRFLEEFTISQEKMSYVDYGFDLPRLQNRNRKQEKLFTFGYIGTHIPAKGIQHLIPAFAKTKNSRLRIWGRPRDQNTQALKAIVNALPKEVSENVEWISEYKNENIVADVFNQVDAIVTPSIWVENSPLVIHEALQARVPVLTADIGGMAEHIQHEVNGLLFNHRDIESLTKQMQRLIDNPSWASQLGSKGYLYTDDGNIPEIGAHTQKIEEIYLKVKKGASQ